MRVAVYANASNLIGEGHAVRCLQLLQVLDVSHVTWFCHSLTSRIVNLLQNTPFDVEQVVVDTGKIEEVLANDSKYDVVIIDDYEVDLTKRLTENLVVVFDDLANRRIVADLLIDANPLRNKADYAPFIDRACVNLIGAKYLMLENAFFAGRVSKVNRQGHIFLGATDPMGLTLICMTYLAELLPDWCWEVVVTAQTPHLESIKSYIEQNESFQLTYEPMSLAPGLKKATLAIGAPGIATWQRMAAGCKVVLTATHSNQVSILKSLEKEGAIYYLGLGIELEKSVVKQKLQSALQQLKVNPRYTFDPYGAKRIKAAILAALV